MPPALERWHRIAGALILILPVACTSQSEPPRSRPAESRRGGDSGSIRPFAYTTPVPEATPTAADGVYARRVTVAQAGGAPVPCRRCAPYRLDAGRSTLTLDSGRYFVSYRPNSPKIEGFTSTGHFIVDGDRVVFFNDPNCTTTRGSYTWEASSPELTFGLRNDRCGIGLRAEYLTALPWTESARS